MSKDNPPYSIWYSLVKAYLKFGLRIYFRDIEIHGKEHIPRGQAVVLAANHPNTFLDALLIASFSPLHPWFLARGDVFGKKWAGWLFTRLRMLPVYRERDGRDALRKNRDVFADCTEILESNGSIIIFPEGMHNREWRVLDIRKGLGRIVAEARNEDVLVIPVGLCYADPSRPFTDVLVQFGKPLHASHYFKDEELRSRELETFTRKVEKALQQLTLHINSDRYHEIFLEVNRLAERGDPPSTQLELFQKKKKWIHQLEEGKKIKKKRRQRSPQRKVYADILLLVLTLPFWAIGKAVTLIPQLIISLVNRKVKDPHFHASVRFSLGLFLYMIVAAGTFIYFWQNENTWFWALIKWLCLMFCTYFVMLWQQKFRETFRTIRELRR